MDTLSVKIVDWFITEGMLDGQKKEYYVCGITSRIEKTIFLISAWLISLPFGAHIEILAFLVVFFLLREHTGGFHAKTFWRCLLCSYAIVLTGLLALPLAAGLPYQYYLLASLLCGGIIWRLAPMNHPAYCGTAEEMAYHKKKSRYYTLFLLACVAIMCLAPVPKLYIAYTIYGMLATAALLIVAKLTGQELVSK